MTPDRHPVGAVDVIELNEGRIRVAGWAQAREVVLHMNGITASARPTLLREDVAHHRGIDAHVGFDLTVPLGPVTLRELRRFGLEIEGIAGHAAPVRLPLNLRRVTILQAKLVMKFAATMVRLAPNGVGWIATRDPKYRAQIKRALRLSSGCVASALHPDLFKSPISEPNTATPITIVLPVYNAFDLLEEVLRRVVAHTDLPWRLIIIEDGSSDDRVRPFLQAWKASHDQDNPNHTDRVILLENAKNIGFIQSVNRGFKQALTWGNNVVLLNSDALVPAGWASRLMSPLVTDASVATVTPMSNDAEIFTAPIICQCNDLLAGQGDAIDAAARDLNPLIDLAAAATGVGYCMGISIKYLRELPQLDTSFGRGYGEEVDWCQRARALGGHHLGVPNVFIEHRGGQSFGSEEKRRLVAQNNAIIANRYPNYDLEVQSFISADPMRSARMALGLAWAASLAAKGSVVPVPIYIAHSLGGGAEDYLQRRIADTHTNHGHPAVILRVGGPVQWQIELITPYGRLAGTTPDLDYVHRMLAPLTRRRIIYSCGVGAQDPAALPHALLALSEDGQHPIDILFHDFYPLSPSYTLLDSHGVYRGTPRPGPEQDSAHSLLCADGTKIDLADWRTRWGTLIAAADGVVVFSGNSAGHVRTAYPEAAGKIDVIPHDLLAQVPVLRQPAPTARRVVGVLGNIGYQKGAALLGDLALTLKKQDTGLAVIGLVDPAYPPPASVRVHGSYQLADLPQIVAQYGITDWLIPSIWPETFSYTTHEALATGFPVHTFAIGAQGDAAAKAANGHTIPFAPDENLIAGLQHYFQEHFNQAERSAI